MTKPKMIDLFAGLGGWAEGGLAEGYDVTGYDIEAHEDGEEKYPAKLVLQDVLTIDGAQFKDAALIVASPPCQEFSYMAMPWSRAKQIGRALRGQDEFPAGYRGSRTIAELTALFDACFRIQREASAAAGHHIPMVVENVRGAEPWVGRAKWSFGSYYLWGDVPALMPHTLKGVAMKPGIAHRDGGATNFHRDLNNGRKVTGLDWSQFGKPGYKAQGFNVTAAQRYRAERHADGGIKQGGNWWHDPTSASRTSSSKSDSRKAASAKIAKIPFALSQWIARTYKPTPAEQAA